jgi:hypothetical protein
MLDRSKSVHCGKLKKKYCFILAGWRALTATTDPRHERLL